MPKRPVQHVVASQAIAAVRQVWALHGSSVQEISEDYGEDLLIQTRLREQMDSSRIWVQVKGKSKKISERGQLPSVRVNGLQVLRWARTADLVVVVLWSTESNTGWYCLPRYLFDHDFLATSGDGKVDVTFSREDVFDLAAAEELAWTARMEHYAKELHHIDATAAEEVEFALDDANFLQLSRAALLFGVLVDIGVFTPERTLTVMFLKNLGRQMYEISLGQEFIDMLNAEREGNGPLNKSVRFGDIGPALMLAIVKTCDATTGYGLPTVLMKALPDVIFKIWLSKLFREIDYSDTSEDEARGQPS
jgi:hypothetical protein